MNKVLLFFITCVLQCILKHNGTTYLTGSVERFVGSVAYFPLFLVKFDFVGVTAFFSLLCVVADVAVFDAAPFFLKLNSGIR